MTGMSLKVDEYAWKYYLLIKKEMVHFGQYFKLL